MGKILSISGYLAIKEVWRNRGRFLLVSLVIALITLLVLFIAALGEGLGNGNREYISKLDAQLIVYQAKSDYLIARQPPGTGSPGRRSPGGWRGRCGYAGHRQCHADPALAMPSRSKWPCWAWNPVTPANRQWLKASSSAPTWPRK